MLLGREPIWPTLRSTRSCRSSADLADLAREQRALLQHKVRQQVPVAPRIVQVFHHAPPSHENICIPSPTAARPLTPRLTCHNPRATTPTHSTANSLSLSLSLSLPLSVYLSPSFFLLRAQQLWLKAFCRLRPPQHALDRPGSLPLSPTAGCPGSESRQIIRAARKRARRGQGSTAQGATAWK